MNVKILNKILANRIQQPIKRSYTMIKLGLSQGCKDSSIYTNQSMWFIILTNLKIKNCMVISMDIVKSFDKSQHPFMIKTL